MKVSGKQVEQIADAIAEGLIAGGHAQPRTDRAAMVAAIREAITADLRSEEALDREVERLLEQHADRLDADGADYRRMFAMLKKKLARDRGV
ncbi:MAG: DUF507 family protein, partial [Myxococcota bacterium]